MSTVTNDSGNGQVAVSTFSIIGAGETVEEAFRAVCLHALRQEPSDAWAALMTKDGYTVLDDTVGSTIDKFKARIEELERHVPQAPSSRCAAIARDELDWVGYQSRVFVARTKRSPRAARLAIDDALQDLRDPRFTNESGPALAIQLDVGEWVFFGNGPR